MPATSENLRPPCWPCGTAPEQQQAYDWFAAELPNLRVAFRWAADHHDLDVAAAIASYASSLRPINRKLRAEPAWAEELIEPARTADHPRLAEIFAVASPCYLTGRIDEGVRYTDAARDVLIERRSTLPSHLEGMIGGAYMSSGHPKRWVEWCRAQLQHGPGINVLNRTSLIFGLVNGGGSGEEAMAAHERPRRGC